jgi:hypothetical protein
MYVQGHSASLVIAKCSSGQLFAQFGFLVSAGHLRQPHFAMLWQTTVVSERKGSVTGHEREPDHAGAQLRRLSAASCPSWQQSCGRHEVSHGLLNKPVILSTSQDTLRTRVAIPGSQTDRRLRA